MPLPYMLIIVLNMTFGFWQGTVLLPGVLSVVFRDLASRIFESELVECSAKCVEMICVITMIEGSRIHTEPRSKDKGPPLCQQSAYPLKVHLTCPAVYMRAELDLCSTGQRRERVKSEFVKRFQQSYASRAVLDSLIKVHVYKAKVEKRRNK